MNLCVKPDAYSGSLNTRFSQPVAELREESLPVSGRCHERVDLKLFHNCSYAQFRNTMRPTNSEHSAAGSGDHAALRKGNDSTRSSSDKPASGIPFVRRTLAYDRMRQTSLATRTQIQLCVLFIAWWVSNAAYAVNTDRLFRAHPFHAYAIDLTLGQILFTVFLVISYAYVDHIVRDSRPATEQSNTPSLWQQTPALASLVLKSPALLTAAFAQVAAALLTALSYATVGAASTLIWKFAEPLTTVVVKWVILRSVVLTPASKTTSVVSAGTTSPSEILSVIVILVGCLIYSWTADTTIPELLPVLLSNLLTPLRNTCFKRHQLRYTSFRSSLPSSVPTSPHFPNHTASDTPVMAFVVLTLATCPFVPILIILRVIFHNFFFVPASLTLFDLELFTPSWASITFNSILYTFYQCASVCLLSLVDPVTHAVLNAFKRLAALVVASVLLHFQQLSLRHAVAALFSTSGFVAYALATHRRSAVTSLTHGSEVQSLALLKKNDSEKPHVNSPRRQVQMGVVIAILVAVFVIALLFVNNVSWNASPTTHSTLHQSKTKTHNPHFWTNAIYVRVTPYMVENFSVTSYADSHNVPGNLGDLLWKYAANEYLVKFPENRTIDCPIDHVSPWACIHSIVNPSPSRPVVIYAPMANYLSDSFGHLLHVLNVYANHPLVHRVIIAGIGVQESFPSRGLTSEDVRTDQSVRDAARAYQLSASSRADIAALANADRVAILTRGEVSRLVLRKMGVLSAKVLGCPSIWVNEEIRLGEKLFTRYDQLSKRVNDSSIKIAIPVSAFPRYYWVYKSLAKIYPNAKFIAQTSHDFVKLADMGIPFSNVQAYRDAKEWVTDMKNFDVVFGGRMHGILAGIMAGTPVMAIAVDWRMAELCQALGIPFLTPFDDIFKQKIYLDIADIVNEIVIPFDAPSFDRNRCRIARVVKEQFESVGIAVNNHIEKIEHLC